jgi:hypothetical protein
MDPVAGAAKRPSRSHPVAAWPRFWNVDQPPPELAEESNCQELWMRR